MKKILSKLHSYVKKEKKKKSGVWRDPAVRVYDNPTRHGIKLRPNDTPAAGTHSRGQQRRPARQSMDSTE